MASIRHLVPLGGAINIGSGAGTVLLTSTNLADQEQFSLDSNTSVNLSGSTSVTVDQNVLMFASATSTAWTVTTPILQVNAGAVFESLDGNAMTIQSTTGSLSVTNAAGSEIASSQLLTIQDTSTAAGASVLISGTGIYKSQSNNINISTAGSNTISFGNNIAFQPGTGGTHSLNLTSSIIDLGTNTISTSATGGAKIAVTSPSGDLTIEGGSGGTGTLSSGTSNTITIAPSSGLLTFQSDGASATTIIIMGTGTPAIGISSGSSGMTVAANTTLQTRGNTTVNITGGGTLTITNNTSSLTTNGGTRTMTIESTSGALSVVNNGTIASGTALTIKDTDATTGANLSISGTGSFSTGSTALLSTAGTNTLSFGANTSFTTGGSSSALTITSSVIDFGSHTVTDATSGSAIIVNSPSGALTIEAGSGGTGTLVSTGGNISVTPSSGLLTFQSDGGSAATIRLNTGGTGTVTNNIGFVWDNNSSQYYSDIR